MNTTIQLTLDADLVEALKQSTAQQGVTFESALSDLARQYVRETRRAKLRAEFERYQSTEYAPTPMVSNTPEQPT